MSNTKEQLAEMLENNEGEYISGEAIADQLGITRAAIWKNIKQLEEDGYEIEAVSRNGYRLGPSNDIVSVNKIRQYLDDEKKSFDIEVKPVVTSTNTIIKEKARELPDGYTLVAMSQTKGRGRREREFFSPSDTGVYISVLVKEAMPAFQATSLTTAAAVAVCRAIDESTNTNPSIKWVNDVFANGKKVCGILTEASLSIESGLLDWAIVGVGINVYEPAGGFSSELREVAGAIVVEKEKDLRSRITAAFLRNFRSICADLTAESLAAEYKNRSFLIGLPIIVLKGNETIPAIAEDIDNECRLIVRYEDGRVEALSSGEVSVRKA